MKFNLILDLPQLSPKAFIPLDEISTALLEVSNAFNMLYEDQCAQESSEQNPFRVVLEDGSIQFGHWYFTR
jgi:hypothetical protein